MNTDKKFKITFGVTILVGLIPLVTYFCKFNGVLSSNHGDWAEFASIYGGILGPAIALLAYLGLLWNLDVTKTQFTKQVDVTTNQFRQQSEDSTFFNLINLHNNKVQMIKYEQGRDKEVNGFGAFKKYNECFRILFDEESILVARREISKNTDQLTHNAYAFLWKRYANQFNEKDHSYGGSEEKKNKIIDLFNKSDDKWELQKSIIGTDNSLTDDDTDELKGIGFICTVDMQAKERIQIIKIVSSEFYDKYGHMLGHYFRNIHYLLKFIDSSERARDLAKIFRAQLSRYELAALYYNSLSDLSGIEFIELLMKYDILNGIYFSDICYEPNDSKRHKDLVCILEEKRANQQVDPIVKTPVDEVEAQGTQGHP